MGAITSDNIEGFNRSYNYDISTTLRARKRRLKWIRDTLQIGALSLTERGRCTRCTQSSYSGMCVSGSTIMVLPARESVEGLSELAPNESDWGKLAHSIHSPKSHKRAH